MVKIPDWRTQDLIHIREQFQFDALECEPVTDTGLDLIVGIKKNYECKEIFLVKPNVKINKNEFNVIQIYNLYIATIRYD